MDAAHVFARRLGEVLRRERTIACLTQLALAERAGVTQATIARWEAGTRAPSLQQIDRALAALNLQLRLDVEQRSDPAAPWHQELARLASLTPDQRLAETGLPLVPLLESAARYGAEALVDGPVASRLQGMPGLPRRVSLAVPHTALEQWVTLRPVVRSAVDSDLTFLRTPRAEIPELLSRQGGGLISTLFGFVELRAYEVRPTTIKLSLHDDFTETSIEADVVSLADLPVHLVTPSS